MVRKSSGIDNSGSQAAPSIRKSADASGLGVWRNCEEPRRASPRWRSPCSSLASTVWPGGPSRQRRTYVSAGIALRSTWGRPRSSGRSCRSSAEFPRGRARRLWSQMWSHSPEFAAIRRDPSVTVSPGHGRSRTPVNAGQHCWKACKGQPFRSSNLLSSATLTCKNIGEWPLPSGLIVSSGLI
jgi:hypothetical protein